MIGPDSARGPSWRIDRLLPPALWAVAFAFYVYTLLPGLGGTEDSPKFQWIGAVLGTAHDPGYPLYMVACWVFSKLPVGTLAYRINLLSAFWGATAVMLAFLAMRRLSVGRGIAISAALGLGLGRTFWQHATFAEAYTQTAAFSAAALLALLVWDENGRRRWLYTATAAASLAFGTHLIIVGMVPAFGWFALSRFRWRPPVRVLAVVALIVALGVAQYGYVWLRTVQGARYLEARATSVTDLVNVLRARQFQSQIFTESPATMARARGLEIGTALYDDLGAIATAASIAGLIGMWRTRRRAVLLLALSIAGTVALLAALGSVATAGILLPALVPCWILAAAGLDHARRRPSKGGPFRAGVIVAALLAIAIPVSQVWHNWRVDNRRADTYFTDYFSALAQSAPQKSAFIDEDYTPNHMLGYEKYASGWNDAIVAAARRPERVAALMASGYRVFAFDRGMRAMRGWVRYRPVTLRGVPLDERLRALPPGTVVVIAGWAPVWPSIPALRDSERVVHGGRAAVILVAGHGLAYATLPGFEGTVSIRRGDPLGLTGVSAPLSIHVDLQGRYTSVYIDDQAVAADADGVVVTELGPGLRDAYLLEPSRGMLAPIDMTRLPLFEVVATVPATSCVTLASHGWTEVTGTGSASSLVLRADSLEARSRSWLAYLAGDSRMAPRLASDWQADAQVFTTREFQLPGDGARLQEQMVSDGLPDPRLDPAASVVTRVEIRADHGSGLSALGLEFGPAPQRAWVRSASPAGAAPDAEACVLPAEPLEPEAMSQTAILDLGEDRYFGSGWRPTQAETVGVSRETSAPLATLSVPLARAADMTLMMSVQALGFAREIRLTVNGRAAPAQPVFPGWSEVAWTLPAAWWRPGSNNISLSAVPGDDTPRLRQRSRVRVRRVELAWDVDAAPSHADPNGREAPTRPLRLPPSSASSSSAAGREKPGP